MHQQFLDHLVVLSERLLNTGVLLLLVHLFTLGLLVLCVSIGQIILELLDNIHVCVGNLRVILFDIGVLLLVFFGQGADRFILFAFDPLNLIFTFFLFVLPQQEHLMFETSLNFV